MIQAPEGMNYYIFRFKTPAGLDVFGGFIAPGPDDIHLLNCVASLPEGTPVDVCEVSRKKIEELKTMLENDDRLLNLDNDNAIEGNHINDPTGDEIPEAPAGYDYYIFNFKAPTGRGTYGGFISTSPEAVKQIELYKEYPPWTEIDVIKVDRQKFIDIHITLQSSFSYMVI